jgi:hypothetical protein
VRVFGIRSAVVLAEARAAARNEYQPLFLG